MKGVFARIFSRPVQDREDELTAKLVAMAFRGQRNIYHEFHITGVADQTWRVTVERVADPKNPA